MIDFKETHYPKGVILYAVFFYVRSAVSYRDHEEIMVERGVSVTRHSWLGKPRNESGRWQEARGKWMKLTSMSNYQEGHQAMMDFKAFHSAPATVAGIETAHMIQKGQLFEESLPAQKQFTA